MEKETLEQMEEEIKEAIENEEKEEMEEKAENISDTEDAKENQDSEESTVKQDDAQSDSGADSEEASDGEQKRKKGFRKKDKKDEQIEALNDKYQRLFAEFQNYRNRSEKEKAAMFEVGAKSIIEKILPVVDNFERGIASLSEEDLGSPVGEGMSLIYKQMTAALEEMGVTVIETEGKEFDPNLHNAVMHEDNDALGENMISEEFQKGYQYRDTVIRHSMVKVAN